jgi:hypothetical protein
MKTIILGMLTAVSLAFSAGPISFGVKGGIPLNDAFNTVTMGDIHFATNTKRYTVGPELDINLPLGLAIEFDALYRRLDWESTEMGVDTFTHRATTANAWDFPVLLKWRFSPGPIRPYVSVGPTFRNLSNARQVENFFTGSMVQTTTGRPADLSSSFVTGFTAAGGIQLLGHISPEVRYTRWGWNTFRDVSGAFKSNPDQFDFLLGITF